MKIASWQLCCYDPDFSAIPPQPAMRRYSFLLLGLASFCGSQSIAAPYVPAANSLVLERLPFKANDPVARELAQMRATLQRDPRNVDAAVALARRYYEMVGEEGDPRYLGYAQAALAPWWEMSTPPVEVQVLRASLRQFRHDFAGAVTDLTQVLERNPANPQARALRAVIHVVQARYMLARSDCQVLRQVGDPLIGLGCLALVEGLTGNAGAAYQSLNIALTNTSGLSPGKELWLQLRLAELARRLDRATVAESHFKRALALGISDTFLLAAYTDFLLDQRRPAEVVALLKDKTRSDTLLLRLVFAERALHLATAVQRAATLEARYAAAQLRGDTVHQQEEARFSLEVRHDAQKALLLARENWKVQREPSDARIFLEAARAANDSAAARPVLQWLDESHIQDRYLAELGQQIKRGLK